MSGAPANSSGVERLLIVRLSAMGDVIHTLPAAQALREAFPDAEIGWLIEERWAELLCAPGTPRRGPRSAQRPLVDWVHTVNLVGWRKSLFTVATAQQIARVWNDVRECAVRRCGRSAGSDSIGGAGAVVWSACRVWCGGGARVAGELVVHAPRGDAGSARDRAEPLDCRGSGADGRCRRRVSSFRATLRRNSALPRRWRAWATSRF